MRFRGLCGGSCSIEVSGHDLVGQLKAMLHDRRIFKSTDSPACVVPARDGAGHEDAFNTDAKTLDEANITCEEVWIISHLRFGNLLGGARKVRMPNFTISLLCSTRLI